MASVVLRFVQRMPKSEEAIAMTHIWIGRSGALPLTLSLYVDERTGQGRALAKALVNALLNYTSRWEHVKFSCLPVPSSQLEHMPCLRTLSYEGTHIWIKRSPLTLGPYVVLLLSEETFHALVQVEALLNAPID